MRPWLRRLSGKTVIVHVKDFDPSIKGVLTGSHEDCLILRDPIVLDEKSDTVLEHRTAVVLRPSVLFLEVVD